MTDKALEHTDHCKYLGVTLQSNLRFNNHIAHKTCKARQQIGMIKRALYWAPARARLIAYKSLCLPHLEYASCAWDPWTKKEIDQLEMVQSQAIRMISDLKGRRGITEAREELRLELLSERRQKCRIKLLLNIIAKEDAHPVLCAAYDEVIKQTEGAIHTRSQSRNEPRSISTTGNW